MLKSNVWIKKRGPTFAQPCINTEETPKNGFFAENQNPAEQLFVDYALEQMMSLQENDNNNKKLNMNMLV